MAGTGADLVARDEPVEAIERGVFEALGHYRAGELLRPQDELQALFAAGRRGSSARSGVSASSRNCEGFGIEVRPPAARRLYSVGDAAAVFGGHAIRVGIGPVDVEGSHGLRQRRGEGAAAEIELAQREQPPGQRLQLGVQLTRHHLELSLSDDVRRGGVPAR